MVDVRKRVASKNANVIIVMVLIVVVTARCNSVVEHPLMVRWVVGSIELFLVADGAPRLV